MQEGRKGKKQRKERESEARRGEGGEKRGNEKYSNSTVDQATKPNEIFSARHAANFNIKLIDTLSDRRCCINNRRINYIDKCNHIGCYWSFIAVKKKRRKKEEKRKKKYKGTLKTCDNYGGIRTIVVLFLLFVFLPREWKLGERDNGGHSIVGAFSLFFAVRRSETKAFLRSCYLFLKLMSFFILLCYHYYYYYYFFLFLL